MRPLEGKRVFVTGAGGALGRASARLFAREGAAVAVVDVDAAAANETQSLIEAEGGHAVTIVADVRDESQVRAAAETAAQRLGGIDTLFNNAGVMPHQDRSFLHGELELLDGLVVTS